MTDQCQAVKWLSGGWSRYGRCEKAAKFLAPVQEQNTPTWGEWGDPYTTRLCGVHNNVARKGGHFNLFDGMEDDKGVFHPRLKAKTVRGVEDRESFLKRDAANAEQAYRDALHAVRLKSYGVGEELCRDAVILSWLASFDQVTPESPLFEAIVAHQEACHVRDDRKQAMDAAKEALSENHS